MIKLKKILFSEIFPKTSRGLIWTSVVWVFFLFLFYYIFYTLNNVNVNIISAAVASITVILGYFYTHFLEIQRKQQEEKIHEYKELLKGIRVFLLEKNLEQEKQKDLIDKFQNAYYISSLLISKEAYSNLKLTIEILMKHIEKNNSESLDNFTMAQSKFINSLRKEFGEQAIPFNTYYLK